MKARYYYWDAHADVSCICLLVCLLRLLKSFQTSGKFQTNLLRKEKKKKNKKNCIDKGFPLHTSHRTILFLSSVEFPILQVRISETIGLLGSSVCVQLHFPPPPPQLGENRTENLKLKYFFSFF